LRLVSGDQGLKPGLNSDPKRSGDHSARTWRIDCQSASRRLRTPRP
jgi:hypothetical protein